MSTKKKSNTSSSSSSNEENKSENNSLIIEKIKALRDVEAELKRVNKMAKELREHKKELKDEISEYMDEQDVPCLSYGKIVVMKKPKNKRTRLKKADKREQLATCLETLGVQVNESILSKIEESLKGEVEEVYDLKLEGKS